MPELPPSTETDLLKKKGCRSVVWWSLIAGSLTLLAAGYAVHLYNENSGCRLKKTVDLSTATTLESAVAQFRSEYGMLPDSRNSKTPSDATIATTSLEGQRLLAILTGRETGPIHQNLHDLNFFPCREGKEGKNGIIGLPLGPLELRDSFGEPYYLRIDFDKMRR